MSPLAASVVQLAVAASFVGVISVLAVAGYRAWADRTPHAAAPAPATSSLLHADDWRDPWLLDPLYDPPERWRPEAGR